MKKRVTAMLLALALAVSLTACGGDGGTTSGSGSPSESTGQGAGGELDLATAGWEEIDGRSRPSSHLYEGDAPFSAAETAALRDYTLRYDFDVTVSYHATGSLLYAEYGGRQDVNALSRSLGEAVSEVTGYPLTGNGKSCAGYKDWAIDALGIPSLTIEVGCHSAPLAEEELASVFFRNLRVLPAIARWLQRS